MNTIEKYIYQVYKLKSFSKAAKSLFISQPSLSMTVANKEKELGFRIFDRTTKPISLTVEGHIYVDMLEEMLESERNMMVRVKKLSCEKQNSIVIGGSSSIAYYLMPAICGLFYQRYPNVEVTLDLGNFGATPSLSERFTFYQKLDRNELDAIFCYEYDSGKYRGHLIHSERLVVAMHSSMMPSNLAPYALTYSELFGKESLSDVEITDGKLLYGIPFLNFFSKTNSGMYMSELLGDYTPSSCKIINSRHSIVHFNMMCAGIGAMLTGDSVVALSNMQSHDIRYFVFPKEKSLRNIHIVTKKGERINENARNFIATAKELCSGGRTFSLYNKIKL